MRNERIKFDSESEEVGLNMISFTWFFFSRLVK